MTNLAPLLSLSHTDRHHIHNAALSWLADDARSAPTGVVSRHLVMQQAVQPHEVTIPSQGHRLSNGNQPGMYETTAIGEQRTGHIAVIEALNSAEFVAPDDCRAVLLCSSEHIKDCIG